MHLAQTSLGEEIPAEVESSYTLGAEDLELLGAKSGHTRLGFAVLLKFYQAEGRLPKSHDEVPAEAVRHVADQVKVPAVHWPATGQVVRGCTTAARSARR